MGGSSSKPKNHNVSRKKGVIPLIKIGKPCNDRMRCEKKLICSKKDKDKDENGNNTCQKAGNINYQEKYQKYKSKYLDLKEKNNL